MGMGMGMPGMGMGGASGGNRREGDWDCPSCRNHNYASRTECYKCKAAKPPGAGTFAANPYAAMAAAMFPMAGMRSCCGANRVEFFFCFRGG